MFPSGQPFDDVIESLFKKEEEKEMLATGYGRRYRFSYEEFMERYMALMINKEKEEETQLEAKEVDFHFNENSKAHHTEEYEFEPAHIQYPIIRRGQEFKLTVTFDREFDAEKDQLILQFTFGSRPIESKGTLIRLEGTKDLSTSSWGMRIDGCHGKSVSVTVISPAKEFVGFHTLFVETKTKKTGTEDEYFSFKKKFHEKFAVLFNPWCKDDPVYMEDEEHRREYVMNDEGLIWVGNSYWNHGRPWNFGQFEPKILDCCLAILDKSLDPVARGNPIFVTRLLTKMVNSSDGDNGVLVGNWSGNYGSHHSPKKWTGSVDILEEYLETKRSVRYGQCWVFSGLLTTLARTIGIPTRSVTNFESAHDTDASMTIDFHSDINGDPIESMNSDSVWNFHVWNESFFKRPDLPQGNDGWQAIDATPQELSQNVYCCGPSPVKAIQKGEVYLPYDTSFVFGEVNGDRVYWEVKPNGDMEVQRVNKSAIGHKISTKAIGSDNREDLTLCYKHKEGSSLERAAVHTAYTFSSRRDNSIYTKVDESHDVIFDFVPPPEEIMVGSDFKVVYRVQNTSVETRNIQFTITPKVVFYTGLTATTLDKQRSNITLESKKDAILEIPVKASEYEGKNPAETTIKAFMNAVVKETGQKFYDIENFEFKKPPIQAEFPDTIEIWKKYDMTLYFENPLSVPLNNGFFTIDCKRRFITISPDTKYFHLGKPVPKNGKASITVSIQAERAMPRVRMHAMFTSDELTDVECLVFFKVVNTE